MNPNQENEKLRTVLTDKGQQERAVDFLVRKRPHGWGRRSIAPYFKEIFGKEAKVVLDEMIKTRKDQVYEYAYFKQKFGLNPNSLYLRVNQSIMYVVEMMDDSERTYGRFCQMFQVRRKPGVGVVLEFRPECREGDVSDFIPKAVESREDMPKWKQKLDEFLEHGDIGSTFLKENLVLTKDDIESLKNALNVPGILANVTFSSVKVLKVNV